MVTPKRDVLIDTDPRDANPVAKMPQPKIRRLAVFVGTVIIAGLIGVAILAVWLQSQL